MTGLSCCCLLSDVIEQEVIIVILITLSEILPKYERPLVFTKIKNIQSIMFTIRIIYIINITVSTLTNDLDSSNKLN